MNFRKGPQDSDIPTFANVTQGVGRIVEKFVISLIKNRHYAIRHASHEPIDFDLRNQRAGRVVRIRDENQPRLRIYRLENGLEIMPEIWAGRFDCAGAE